MAEDREPLLTPSEADYGYGSTDVSGLSVEEDGTSDLDERTNSIRRLVVLPILFIYMFSFITAFTTVSLYEYHAIAKSLFPDRTDIFDKNMTTNLCEVNTSTQAYKDQSKIQEATSTLNIYLSLAGGIPAVFSNIIYGTYSDEFGRKFLFILPTIGSFLRCLILMLFMYLEVDVYLFVIAFFLEGSLGYFLGMLQAGYSYMADITTANDTRSFAITIVDVALGLGSFLGFFVSGYLIKWTGFTWTMVCSAALLAFIFVLIIFVLPETVPYSRHKDKPQCSNILKYTGNAIAFYSKRDQNNHRWKYILCIIVFFLTTLTVLGRPSVETLFQLGSPFCWDSVKIGYYGTIRSGVQHVVCLILIKPLQFCMNDKVIAITGTLSSLASFVMEGFVTSSTNFYIVPVIGALGVLTMPMVRAIISKMTPENKQGAVFAGAAAVETVGNMVSAVIANAIYSATVAIYRGFVFFVLGMFSFAAFILLLILIIVPQNDSKNKNNIQRNILTV